MKDLAKGHGSRVSYATAVNRSGIVVGRMYFHIDGSKWAHEWRGFLYYEGALHFLRDLVDSGPMRLGYSADINDLGQIVGYAPVTPMINHGFLLTPS